MFIFEDAIQMKRNTQKKSERKKICMSNALHIHTIRTYRQYIAWAVIHTEPPKIKEKKHTHTHMLENIKCTKQQQQQQKYSI